jgi:hypothetical protein
MPVKAASREGAAREPLLTAFIPFALASTLEQVGGVNSRVAVLLIEPSARRLDALDRLVRQSLAAAPGLG